MSVKIFGVKGVGGLISIILPIAIWLVERMWQKETVSTGYRDSASPTGDATRVKEA